MRSLQVLVVVCALLTAASASAVETWHIGGVVGGTIYVKWDADVFSSGNWDDPALNSPLHESWNLVDEYVGGVLNPYYLGAGTTYPHLVPATRSCYRNCWRDLRRTKRTKIGAIL